MEQGEICHHTAFHAGNKSAEQCLTSGPLEPSLELRPQELLGGGKCSSPPHSVQAGCHQMMTAVQNTAIKNQQPGTLLLFNKGKC